MEDRLCFLCLVFLLLAHLVVTCWERVDHLALAQVGNVYCIFVTFLCGVLGQVWYLIVSFPDLCRVSYLCTTSSTKKRNNLFELTCYNETKKRTPDSKSKLRKSQWTICSLDKNTSKLALLFEMLPSFQERASLFLIR